VISHRWVIILFVHLCSDLSLLQNRDRGPRTPIDGSGANDMAVDVDAPRRPRAMGQSQLSAPGAGSAPLAPYRDRSPSDRQRDRGKRAESFNGPPEGAKVSRRFCIYDVTLISARRVLGVVDREFRNSAEQIVSLLLLGRVSDCHLRPGRIMTTEWISMKE
jgi:hypothetical protein